MKKVLLTSAVALAAFGAVQAVSADTPLDKFLVAKTQEEKDNAAKAIVNALKPINEQVLKLYQEYTEAEDAYTTLTPRLEAAQAEITRLRKVVIKVRDMEADATTMKEEAKAAGEYADKARAVLAAKEYETKATELETAKGELKVAQDEETNARLAVKATDSKESAAVKALDKAIEKTKEAQKKVTEAQKAYDEALAKYDEAGVTLAEAQYILAAITAKAANDGVAVAKEEAGLERKIKEAEDKYADLVDEIDGAREKRDAKKAALEKYEKDVASKAYKQQGLEYTRSSVVSSEQTTKAKDTGWVKDNGKWTYVLDVTGKKATGWKQVDGTWYYFNAAGEMQKFWVKDGNTWYYLNGSGELVTGWLQDGGKWYFLDASGAMKASQWIQNNGSWYYLDATGAMKANGWFQVGDKWYYATDSGAIAVNTTVGGYTVNGNGEWV